MSSNKYKQPPVKSTKVVEDGIQFASKLERFCYVELKKAKLFDKYEKEIFHTLDGFHFSNVSYERQSNSKGNFVDRGDKKVRGIYYTPDFTSTDYIIEVKGRPNPTFGLRWKLFKNHLNNIGDKRVVFKPQSQKEILEMIKIIKTTRNDKN